MSTPTTTAAVPAGELRTLDISGTAPVPFHRLVSVELRKMGDTRAGLWLLVSTAALTALVMVIQVWVGLAQDLELGVGAFMIGMNTPMGILLPVLGILSVTSEWGQRTALVTFTQIPSRGRVLASKLAATVVVAVGAVVVGTALAVLANVVFASLADSPAVWGLGAGVIAKYLLLHVLAMATGFAFGMLLLNTAAAVVVYFVFSFVLPGLLELGAAFLDWFRDIRPWVDFGAAQGPLANGGEVTGEQWAHLAVSGLIWVVLPMVLGAWRVLRAEVK